MPDAPAPCDLNARRAIEADDVAGARMWCRQSCSPRPPMFTPTALPRFAPDRIRAEEIADDDVGRAVDLKAGRGVEAKDVGRAGRIPADRVVPRVIEQANHVAEIRSAGVGAEEIADDEFVCAVELKAGRAVEAKDVGRAGRSPSDRVAARIVEHADRVGSLKRFPMTTSLVPPI